MLRSLVWPLCRQKVRPRGNTVGTCGGATCGPSYEVLKYHPIREGLLAEVKYEASQEIAMGRSLGREEAENLIFNVE